MKGLGFWFILLVPGLVQAQEATERSVQQKFTSGAEIRIHLEAGGYTITASDSENIRVTYRARSEDQVRHVRVEIKRNSASADVYISDTPNGNFHATIEVPRRSNLWVRLSAGELVVEVGLKGYQVEEGEGRVHKEDQ